MALHFSRDAKLETRMSQMETLKMQKLQTLMHASLGTADHLHGLEARNAYSRYNNSVALVRERTIPTERPPPVGEVSANFFFFFLRIEGCHVVSATDPHGRFNLCFLDRSRYFLFK